MAAGSIERVQVIIQGLTKGFQKGLDRANNRLSSVGKNVDHFGQVMKAPMENFKTMNRRMGVMKTTGGRLAHGIRNWTHGMRGFRMEMLGVMFFGMAMQRMFLGLLQPVMEAFGVFDLFRLMLLVLFLPVMEMIFPQFLKMLEFFMNLPEPVKKVIGILVLVGVAIGTILMVLGTLALGVGSVIQLIATTSAILGAFGLSFTALIIPILIAAAIIAAVAYGIWLAYEENFGNIKYFIEMIWNGIAQFLGGVFDIIMGLVDFFTALFEGDLDKLWDAVQRIFRGIYNTIVGFLTAIIGFIATILIGIGRLLWGIISIIIQIGQKIWGFLNDLFGGLPGKLYSWGVQMIRGLANGISSMARVVIDAILGLFPPWLRDLIIGAGEWISGAAGNISKGITDFFTGNHDDFIWRPGQGAIGINPNDTLVGYKGNAPFGGGGDIVVNQENHFHGFTKDELSKELDDRDRRAVDEIRRLVKQ